ncbi:MAG: hypothetical protein A2821_03070 [Candidatus Magasanikbacteria bacterium RIFCSPHIGHO2_01_FULL_41_23]|uniref:Methyltransferase type 11 domain-containing protein n=1 Tax=Candidatus Magasanikbacteria bacterium RIFCSPLOWO2_01_FULL_40_15 TaxID=1798686 RepID=A0A1F6N444_9BACT|nr:MAG: hypothetical protein A2821_03070 [Candidatus Magasanikbacteria bacterium RIFCSPHIGHO2_01_FULL_41_23]OGH67319.1 MAG: hypothetical protein A3C66_01085 [Candidatus Magasanikbacteria bacterium RIFCSPHIGHO2_02_FULL_41_35]OGH76544.1 MAG: hypothetical protein A3F22_00295 [Candidatus Magasanikbacteria bacterium RIFCSPHIGHO2_12_FULL_41_16]OGH78470.1 MAG: hypothetical protein A2983_03060 [Candidatus Magasanikbacteria bacterium RIFCSPLOWO2_01_FULL_40_15]
MTHAEFCARYIPVQGRVLDVGSGRGNFVVAMAQLGFVVSGIEINPEYVAESQNKAVTASVSVSLVTGQAEELPYVDNFFDFANCAEVTEHTNNPEKICQGIYRVLKPGGSAYISFHNRFGVYDYHYHLYGINWIPRSWTEVILRVIGRQKPDGEKGRQKLTTMHYYTFRQAVDLLARSGFQVTDIRVQKIKERFGLVAPAIIFLYYVCLRPFYFNTFHFLIEKV